MWQRKDLAYVTTPCLYPVTEIDLNARRVIKSIPEGQQPEGEAFFQDTGQAISLSQIVNPTFRTSLKWIFKFIRLLTWPGIDQLRIRQNLVVLGVVTQIE
jgi:hypothetical protein